MKTPILILFISLLSHFASAQLNVELLHQLIAESKSENGKQSDARDRQAESTMTEEGNKVLMVKLKEKYRDIHSRFKTLGLAIDAAQIAINAYPLLNDILTSQQRIYQLCSDDPFLSILAIQAEIDMGERAYSLINFTYALTLSIGDVNQMKPSDRKMLFSHIVTELRLIAGISRGLAASLGYSSKSKVLQGLNPFSDFLNTDRKLIDEILRKKNILKN